MGTKGEGIFNAIENLDPAIREELWDQFRTWLIRYRRCASKQEKIRWLKSLMREIDKQMDTMIASAAKKNNPISCKRGCSFCCYVPVEISKTEAMLIVEEMDEEDVHYLKKQFGHEGFIHNWKRMKHTDRKCLFLDNNECSIYDIRPLNCRTYTVSSPAEDCDIEGGKPEVMAEVDLTAEVIKCVVGAEGAAGPMPEMLVQEYLIRHAK